MENQIGVLMISVNPQAKDDFDLRMNFAYNL